MLEWLRQLIASVAGAKTKPVGAYSDAHGEKAPPASDSAEPLRRNILPRSALMGDDDVPFAWRHIVLVDRKSHAGRVLAKIKRGAETKGGPLERT